VVREIGKEAVQMKNRPEELPPEGKILNDGYRVHKSEFR